MSKTDLLAIYGDILEEKDDPRLFAVARKLDDVYARGKPPAELERYVHAVIDRAMPTPATPRARSWRQRYLRRPLTLVAAVLVAGALAGGATYAMKGFGLFSGPTLRSTCSGTTISIASPAQEVSSPEIFVKDGGTLTDIPAALKQEAQLQHPSYWVVPAGAVVENTCVGANVSEVEIGTNTRKNTELWAVSVVPFSQSTEPTKVGFLLIPTGHGCAFRPAAPPVSSPGGQPVAQLQQVPVDLPNVSALFTPCFVPEQQVPTAVVPSVVPPSEQISFHVYSEVRYQGSAGSIIVLVAKPSPAAARPGLDLGNRVGTLPDGTPLYGTSCQGDCPPYGLEWLDHGLIVTLTGDLPVDRMKQLAADVEIR